MVRRTKDTAVKGYATERLSLIELLDRVIDKGVVIGGDLTISVADIDLLYVGLRAIVCSVDRLPAWSPLRQP